MATSLESIGSTSLLPSSSDAVRQALDTDHIEALNYIDKRNPSLLFSSPTNLRSLLIQRSNSSTSSTNSSTQEENNEDNPSDEDDYDRSTTKTTSNNNGESVSRMKAREWTGLVHEPLLESCDYLQQQDHSSSSDDDDRSDDRLDHRWTCLLCRKCTVTFGNEMKHCRGRPHRQAYSFLQMLQRQQQHQAQARKSESAMGGFDQENIRNGTVALIENDVGNAGGVTDEESCYFRHLHDDRYLCRLCQCTTASLLCTVEHFFGIRHQNALLRRHIHARREQYDDDGESHDIHAANEGQGNNALSRKNVLGDSMIQDHIPPPILSPLPPARVAAELEPITPSRLVTPTAAESTAIQENAIFADQYEILSKMAEDVEKDSVTEDETSTAGGDGEDDYLAAETETDEGGKVEVVDLELFTQQGPAVVETEEIDNSSLECVSGEGVTYFPKRFNGHEFDSGYINDDDGSCSDNSCSFDVNASVEEEIDSGEVIGIAAWSYGRDADAGDTSKSNYGCTGEDFGFINFQIFQAPNLVQQQTKGEFKSGIAGECIEKASRHQRILVETSSSENDDDDDDDFFDDDDDDDDEGYEDLIRAVSHQSGGSKCFVQFQPSFSKLKNLSTIEEEDDEDLEENSISELSHTRDGSLSPGKVRRRSNAKPLSSEKKSPTEKRSGLLSDFLIAHSMDASLDDGSIESTTETMCRADGDVDHCVAGQERQEPFTTSYCSWQQDALACIAALAFCQS